MRRTVERRPVVLASALLMFSAIFAWRQVISDPNDEIALLYVMPIALVALELGIRGGLAAAALAIALVGVWLLSTSATVDVLGVVTRAFTFAAVGGIAGRFSDRMQDGQRRYRLLLHSGLTLAHLDADADVPHTLAEQARELVPASGTAVELADGRIVSGGQAGSSGYSERFPLVLRGRPYGTLQIDSRRPLAGEDRAALAILGLQAAVAAENRQLLESERERAVIEAQLRDAQVLLDERGGQLRALMSRQELERGQLSSELHDDAAQVLAAVLMSLKALELERGRDGAEASLDGESWRLLRADVESTLQLLRALAIGLRPPVLRLGLKAALEDLAENTRAEGQCEFEFDLDPELELEPELETTIYRIVEEALHALEAPKRISVHHQGDGGLVIEARGAGSGLDYSDRLRVLTARAELLGGSVSASPSGLRVVVPAGRGRQGPPFEAAATG